jgi:hypothetical protein
MKIRNRSLRTSLLTALVALAAAFATAGPAAAQTLTLFYVGPTADMISHFPPADLVGVNTTGFRGIQIKAGSEATFRTEASADIVTLYDALQPGQTLRTRVDQVMQIADATVDVELYLVDDLGGITASSRFVLVSDNGASPVTQHVWPAAGSSDLGGGSWRGRIGMGQWSIDLLENRPGGWTAVEATVLHEVFHTQSIETGPHGRFAWPVVGGRLISYGANGNHWVEEILGDQALPMEEGLGTFFGHLHNAADHQPTIDFFRDDGRRYLLEAQSVAAGWEDLYNAPRRRGTVGSDTVWEYRWRDVPGYYLLFSESTSTAYHFFFWRTAHTDRDKTLEWVLESADAMHEARLKRFLTYAANRLALQMEQYAATPEGQAQKTAGTLVSSIFPYALLDVLTHFGMTEDQYKADHDRHDPDSSPLAYTEYWNHRAALEAAARPHLDASPIEIEEAIEAVRTYLTDAGRILEAVP